MAKKKKTTKTTISTTNKQTENSKKENPKRQIESIIDNSKALFSPISTKLALILTLIAACLYFAFSFVSEGFYQQDEAVHYVSMKRFWFNPNRILSNWEKPGFKLIYALPSLLGVYFVTFFNCLLAAFSGFLS